MPVFTLNEIKAPDENYTYVPDMYFDLMPYLKPAEYKAIHIILRHYPDFVPFDFFSSALKYRPSEARRTLSSLVQMGLIFQSENGYQSASHVTVDTDNFKRQRS